MLTAGQYMTTGFAIGHFFYYKSGTFDNRRQDESQIPYDTNQRFYVCFFTVRGTVNMEMGKPGKVRYPASLQ